MSIKIGGTDVIDLKKYFFQEKKVHHITILNIAEQTITKLPIVLKILDIKSKRITKQNNSSISSRKHFTIVHRGF